MARKIRELMNDVKTLKLYTEIMLATIVYPRGANIRLKYLLEYGVRLCMKYIPVYTHHLRGNVDYKIVTDGRKIIGGKIYIPDVDYAKFVEFGTGIVGKQAKKHPFAKDYKYDGYDGWEYDINEHGFAGWTYYDEELDDFRVTQGQKATAFMYLAYAALFNFIESHITNKKWYYVDYRIDKNGNPMIVIEKERYGRWTIT